MTTVEEAESFQRDDVKEHLFKDHRFPEEDVKFLSLAEAENLHNERHNNPRIKSNHMHPDEDEEITPELERLVTALVAGLKKEFRFLNCPEEQWRRSAMNVVRRSGMVVIGTPDLSPNVIVQFKGVE